MSSHFKNVLNVLSKIWSSQRQQYKNAHTVPHTHTHIIVSITWGDIAYIYIHFLKTYPNPNANPNFTQVLTLKFNDLCYSVQHLGPHEVVRPHTMSGLPVWDPMNVKKTSTHLGLQSAVSPTLVATVNGLHLMS